MDLQEQRHRFHQNHIRPEDDKAPQPRSNGHKYRKMRHIRLIKPGTAVDQNEQHHQHVHRNGRGPDMLVRDSPPQQDAEAHHNQRSQNHTHAHGNHGMGFHGDPQGVHYAIGREQAHNMPKERQDDRIVEND